MPTNPAPITRRAFIGGTAATAAAISLPRPITGAPAVIGTAKPNLLFINVDQLSAEAVGVNGCAHVRTPAFDYAARRGVNFTRSYSANPVCCPARSCWQTGRASSEHGVVLNSLPMRTDLPDLGQWLGARGYQTIHAGKWHVPGRDVRKSYGLVIDGTGQGEYSDHAVSRAAAGWMLNRKGADPFFMVVGLLQPHDICYWPRLNTLMRGEMPYPDLRGHLPPAPPNYDFDPREPETFLATKRKSQSFDWPEELWRYYIWAYYRHVEMVDACVGLLLDTVESSGLAKDTLVIVTSDHGDGHGRHRLVFKSDLYDAAARVPLMISWPGHVAGDRTDARLASGLDLFPTLCDYAGVDPPQKQRGRSLRPVLEDRATEWREFIISESNVTGRMVRTDRFKYVQYRGDATDQLFDMQADPWETKNLFADGSFGPTVEGHRKLLADWESRLEIHPEPEGGWREPAQKAGAKGKRSPGQRP